MSIPNLTLKVKEAIASGSDVNDDTRNKHRPLQLALKEGYTDVARILIVNGADVHFRDKSGLDPIHVAINCGEFKNANLLIEYGAKFNRNLPDLQYDYSKWHDFVHFHYQDRFSKDEIIQSFVMVP